MSNRTHCLFTPAAALMLVSAVGTFLPLTRAAEPPDKAKPMMNKEPMAGEMKKDGMLKEEVGKAARKWDKKMDATMKQEKMK